MIMADEYLGLDLDQVIFGMIGCYARDVEGFTEMHALALSLEWYAKNGWI